MMKTICIIAGSFTEYQILKPLIKQFQKDQRLYCTVVLMDRHKSFEMEIFYTHIEEEGFIVDEKTDIVFRNQKNTKKGNPVIPEQSSCDLAHCIPVSNDPADYDPTDYDRINYDLAFEALNPDMVILFGNTYPTLIGAIAASQKNIPIAHIQGGESKFGVFDDSYGYGITKLSDLHFTSTEKYRQQVIQFGEHADKVFNVGSLMIKKIKDFTLEKKLFYDKIELPKKGEFLLVSFHPDPSLGSRNANIFQEILDTLSMEQFKKFKLLFNKPKAIGLGKMIIQSIDDFIANNPDMTISIPYMNLSDLSCAIKYCSVVIGNNSDSIVIAPSFKTPVVNIGDKLQGRDKTKNIIDCNPLKDDILCAIQNGLSTNFKSITKDITSP
ncbi:UDP-N-acetylglucosamine 2-epimerase, partial [Desulfobacterales bacterium HSG17]|nr:UDP-N-acetylglucosamine 2-epimerase [Desulfobacterales bacterium HSG17]